MMAATGFIRSLVGWRPSSSGGPITPEEDVAQAESGVSEPHQVASSALGIPPVSLAEPMAGKAPETPSADDRASSDGRVEQPASSTCSQPTTVLSASELAREFDFTERQARFLILVMRHSGVCMLRQYSTFAGIVHGQKTCKFFHKLVSRRHASTYACAHHRARIYHVHDKALYRAIGMPDHYHRRPVTLSRAIERLMLLDDALANAELTWLVTDAEKTAHFGHLNSSSAEVLPRTFVRRGNAETPQYFPDKLPIGIARDGRIVLVYLFTQSGDASLRRFLHRHAPLLRALRAWTLRVLFPKEVAGAVDSCQRAVRTELASPLRPAVVDELRWYFEELKAASPIEHRSTTVARFDRAHRAFAAPRFGLVYRAWLRDGEFALEGVASNAIDDALTNGDGRLECAMLKLRYCHLANLAGTS
jgi:hypothetical protein